MRNGGTGSFGGAVSFRRGVVGEVRERLVGEVHDHTMTAAYRTAVGHRASEPLGLTLAQYHCPDMNGTPNAAECIIAPGNIADSVMAIRFDADPVTMAGRHMPAAGSEMIDPTGDTWLHAWITTP